MGQQNIAWHVIPAQEVKHQRRSHEDVDIFNYIILYILYYNNFSNVMLVRRLIRKSQLQCTIIVGISIVEMVKDNVSRIRVNSYILMVINNFNERRYNGYTNDSRIRLILSPARFFDHNCSRGELVMTNCVCITATLLFRHSQREIVIVRVIDWYRWVIRSYRQ